MYQPIYMTLTSEDVSAMCEQCTGVYGFDMQVHKINVRSVGLREGIMYALVALAYNVRGTSGN